MTTEQQKNIAAYLMAKPTIEKVYFNDKGEYLFIQREGYDKEITRREILGKNDNAEQTETTSKTKKS